jgi:hypothetical protein
MKRQHWALLVGGLLLAALGYRVVSSALAASRTNKAKAIAEQRLSAETAARLAVTVVERDSLAELLKAARQLNGKLIAGVQIGVPKRDTLVRHDTLYTEVIGETRTAEFLDSTFAGVIAGKVTAPPAFGPLSVEYQLTRPAFSPQVGIVRTGDAHFAVVNWRGELAEVQIPYVDVPLPRKRVYNYIEGSYSPTGPAQVRAGMAFEVGKGLVPSADFGMYLWDGKMRGPHASVSLRYVF